MTTSGFTNFRHKFAFEDLMEVKGKVEILTDWEQEFILSILEAEKLTSEQCTLSHREFAKLQEIVANVKRRKP